MARRSPVLSIHGFCIDWTVCLCRCRAVVLGLLNRRSGVDSQLVELMLFADLPLHRLPEDGYCSTDSCMYVKCPKGSEVQSVRKAGDLSHGIDHALTGAPGETMKCISFQGAP